MGEVEEAISIFPMYWDPTDIITRSNVDKSCLVGWYIVPLSQVFITFMYKLYTQFDKTLGVSTKLL